MPGNVTGFDWHEQAQKWSDMNDAGFGKGTKPGFKVYIVEQGARNRKGPQPPDLFPWTLAARLHMPGARRRAAGM